MKKGKYLLFALCAMFMFTGVASAAPSYSFYTSVSSVENGKTVTATVALSKAAAWNVKIISAGNTNGCSQSFADATNNGNNTTKYLSVTCKATSIGAISFTLSGDVTSSDGSNINVSGSKRVSVVEPRPASQNNYLASLKVDGYDITPAFDEETKEYSVSVPSTVNEVTISSKVKDQYASVSGNGTFPVDEGSNSFKIVVTAESGATREYVVNVNVEDLNPIYIKAGENEYSVIKNPKNVEAPELFELSSTLVNGVEVPAYNSDSSDFILVPVKDAFGKTLFVIANEDGSYTDYKTIKVGNLIFYIMKDSTKFDLYEEAELNFEDFSIKALQLVDNKDYYLIYGRNMSTGNVGWYKYDSKESTLQRYENAVELGLKKKIDDYLLIIFIFGIGLLLCILIVIVALMAFGHKRKKMKIDYQLKVKDMEIQQMRIQQELKEKEKKEVKDKKNKKNKKEEVKLEQTKEFGNTDMLNIKKEDLLAKTIKMDAKKLKKSNKK